MESFSLCQSYLLIKNLLNIKEANTPFDVSFKLTENIDRLIVQIEYVSPIGNSIYIIHYTKLDITSTICKLSRFEQSY